MADPPNAPGHLEILGDLATDSSWQPMSRGLPHRFGPSIALRSCCLIVLRSQPAQAASSSSDVPNR